MAWVAVLPLVVLPAIARDESGAFGRRQGAPKRLVDAAAFRDSNSTSSSNNNNYVAKQPKNGSSAPVTLTGWIKDVRAAHTLPPRWRRSLTVADLRAAPPRPFDAAFDELWLPWLRAARPTAVSFLRKSMWEVRLDAAALFSEDGAHRKAALEAVGGAGAGDEAFGVFRPQWGWRERPSMSSSAYAEEPLCEVAEESATHSQRGSKMLRTEAARELLAFKLDRLLGLYRAPPLVWRCFDVAAELSDAVVGIGGKSGDGEEVRNDEGGRDRPGRKVREVLLADAALHAAPDDDGDGGSRDAGVPPGRRGAASTEGQRGARRQPRVVCGTLAMGLRGVTMLCPRLQTSFHSGCTAAPREEVADLALFDTFTEIDDRSPSSEAWPLHSGMFEHCEAERGGGGRDDGGGSGSGASSGVTVHNMHCAGPTGALLFIDQGVSFGGEPRGIPLKGLCVGAATRNALLALDGPTFRKRFSALLAGVEVELVSSTFPPAQRAAARVRCKFREGIEQRLARRFDAVRRYVQSCTPNLRQWLANAQPHEVVTMSSEPRGIEMMRNRCV